MPLSITTGAGPNQLLVVNLSGHESLSELFRFELDMLAPAGATIPFNQVLAAPATVTIQGTGGASRLISGIITRLTKTDSDAKYAHFRAELSPHLWILTKSFQSRIFQQLTVPQVLQQVLQGINITWNLSGSYPTLTYCVQYRETDFAFASRLMEQAGIYYYFQHQPNQDVMVVSDQKTAYANLPGTSTLIYHPGTGAPQQAYVTQWYKTQTLAASSYTVADYHFQMPQTAITSTAQVAPSATVGTVTHSFQDALSSQRQVYDYPGEFARQFDCVAQTGGAQPSALQGIFDQVQTVSKLWMAREASACLDAGGQATYVNLLPGYQFTMQQHPDANGSYLIKNVETTAHMTGPWSGNGEVVFDYQARFRCQPASVAYAPPLRTPKPRICGPQTAVVTGSQPNAPDVDQYGRVKVQFFWDRQGQNNLLSSCWVRVAQLWAGQGVGSFFWPRPGHEVVVLFEDGEWPIIVGSVYNNVNTTPFSLPQQSSIMGIKTSVISGSVSGSGMGGGSAPTYGAGDTGTKTMPGEIAETTHYGQSSSSGFNGLAIDDSSTPPQVQVLSQGYMGFCAAAKMKIQAPYGYNYNYNSKNIVNNVMTTITGWGQPPVDWETQPPWSIPAVQGPWYEAAPLAIGVGVETAAGYAAAGALDMLDVFSDVVFVGGRYDITRGSHMVAAAGLSNQYTFFTRNEVVIDPSILGAMGIPVVSKYIFGTESKIPLGWNEVIYGNCMSVRLGMQMEYRGFNVVEGVGNAYCQWPESHPITSVWTGLKKLIISILGLAGQLHAAATLTAVTMDYLYGCTGDETCKTAGDIAGDTALIGENFGVLISQQEELQTLAAAAVGAAGLNMIKQTGVIPGPTNFDVAGMKILTQHMKWLAAYQTVVAPIPSSSQTWTQWLSGSTSQTVFQNIGVGGTFAVQANSIEMISTSQDITIVGDLGVPILIDSVNTRVSVVSGSAMVNVVGSSSGYVNVAYGTTSYLTVNKSQIYTGVSDGTTTGKPTTVTQTATSVTITCPVQGQKTSSQLEMTSTSIGLSVPNISETFQVAVSNSKVQISATPEQGAASNLLIDTTGILNVIGTPPSTAASAPTGNPPYIQMTSGPSGAVKVSYASNYITLNNKGVTISANQLNLTGPVAIKGKVTITSS